MILIQRKSIYLINISPLVTYESDSLKNGLFAPLIKVEINFNLD